MLLASGAFASDPVSRPLAAGDGSRKATVEDVGRMPAPSLHMLTASVGRTGKITVRCEEVENVAFRGWRARIENGRTQETR